MDYRLDLYNAVENYENEMNEDDGLFIVCHNAKDGDMLVGISGNLDVLINAVSNPNGYVKIETKEQLERHDGAQGMILNMALNILENKPELKKNLTNT